LKLEYNNMKVSVIITTYQQPDFLSEAIESILTQTFNDLELIVVNDDPLGQETEKIVLSYNDPRIIYIKNEKNFKGAKSLNIGLRAAKGEYIAILDDDDAWISKDKLEKQVNFLEKNPEYIIVGTSSIHIDRKTNKEITRYTGGFNLKNIEKFILTKVPFAHSSILCRRNAMISVGGYSEDLPRAKDIDLYIKLVKLGKFGFLPECFIKYREIVPEEDIIIKKHLLDAFFHKKVIWRHRKDFPHIYFLSSYLKISLRYLIFRTLIFLPLLYKIYRKVRYNKEDFLPTLKIPSVSRIGLDIELARQFKRLKPGIVLEAGSGCSGRLPYKKYIPHTKYLTLDIDKKSKPDICCDLHDIKWESDYFDAVVAIEVLEHLYNPQKAIDEMRRILKPGGVCLLSTRFIHPYHPGPKDYYRFTWDSLNYLFRDFQKVEVFHHGNKIQSLWQILADGKLKIFLNIFNPLIARISSRKTRFPCGFIVYAEK